MIPVAHPVSAAPSTPARQVAVSAQPAALQPIAMAHQALGGQVLPGPSRAQILSPRPASLSVSTSEPPAKPSTLAMVQEAAVAAQALLFPADVAAQSAHNLYQLSHQPQQTTSVKRKAPEDEPTPAPKAKKPR